MLDEQSVHKLDTAQRSLYTNSLHPLRTRNQATELTYLIKEAWIKCSSLYAIYSMVSLVEEKGTGGHCEAER